MDIPSSQLLAAAALATLQPILLEKAAGMVIDQVPAAVGKLWKAVKDRFDTDAAAKRALDKLLGSPADERLRTVVEVQLEELLEGDPIFARQVKRLVDEARQVSQAQVEGSGALAQGSGNLVLGERAVNSQGNYNTIITGDGQVVPKKEKKQHAS
ncbi:MAG TPA: hypothetical protein VIO61_06720 [Anaerolineaceae bacterium]